MSTKISELSSLVGGIPATNAVPISVDGTTYKVNLGNLAEETASADVLTAIGAANKAALATAVVDGTAINPSSIGATTPTGNITSSGIIEGGAFNAGNYPNFGTWFNSNGYVSGGYVIAGSFYGFWDGDGNIQSARTYGTGAVIQQRDGTTAQEYQLFGTYTSSTVYERLSSKYDSGSGAFVIGTEKGASGGSARPLVVQNSSNMTVAFAVRNVAGTDIFGVDTTNRFVQSGGDAFGVSTTTGNSYLYNNGSIVWSTGSTASGGLSTPGPSIGVCSGSPEGVVTAPVGSVRMRSDGGAGTSFYVKESGTGNTGWVAK